MRLLLTLLSVVSISLFLSGCAGSEEESTLPWSTPTQWESNRLPGGIGSGSMGDRSY